MTVSKSVERISARDRIAVALDVATLDEASRLAERVAPHAGVLKIGLELFVAEGPRAVEVLSKSGARIFLDLKLHDIPETVARSVARARDLGVSYLTLHAGGGRAMLEAARRESGATRLLGVTVLTSISAEDLPTLGVVRSLDDHALELARLCDRAGVEGLVASALEVERLRAALPRAFLVTPGIRPSGSAAADQARVATPAAAIAAGADLLVVGRPIRDASDAREAAAAIEAEVARALESVNP